MPDERAGVGVAFYAVAFHQNYAVLLRFAEMLPAIGGDPHHPLQQEIVGRQHQAARASERRFWRR